MTNRPTNSLLLRRRLVVTFLNQGTLLWRTEARLANHDAFYAQSTKIMLLVLMQSSRYFMLLHANS